MQRNIPCPTLLRGSTNTTGEYAFTAARYRYSKSQLDTALLSFRIDRLLLLYVCWTTLIGGIAGSASDLEHGSDTNKHIAEVAVCVA